MERRFDLRHGRRGRRRADHDGEPLRARPLQDGYGPVGAWFLLFSQATNAYGEDYMVKNKEMLNDTALTGRQPFPPPACATTSCSREMKEGRGPIYMDTVTAGASCAETLTPKEVKHLEAEAWEDFLDMCVGQCGIWVGENIEPEEAVRTDADREPHLLGSHSGCCGIWVSGRPTSARRPRREELPGVPDHTCRGLELGLSLHDHRQGSVHRRRRRGRLGHKFSSGSHTEGRLAAKAMVKFALDNADKPEVRHRPPTLVEPSGSRSRTFLEFKDYTTAIDVNPNYITPKMLQFRLQKIMDEYVAGVATYYNTNDKMLAGAKRSSRC